MRNKGDGLFRRPKIGLLCNVLLTVIACDQSVAQSTTDESVTSESRPNIVFVLTEDHRWKYIETRDQGLSDEVFPERYDLSADALETYNLATNPAYHETVDALAADLRHHQETLFTPVKTQPQVSVSPPQPERTDLFISGVYPHLTTYGVYSQNGGHDKPGHNECGIGAVVPWAGKLWLVNYAPHMPHGSEHKLFSIDPNLNKPMTIHPESVGGTPAGRMIHAESNQLLIAHHLIDAKGNVRTISPTDMPIRVTAIARHLTDPANLVFYVDMEGSIWEANVHTLAVKRLFKKPVPGWHGKGGYTSQGRLVVTNNGEHKAGDYKDLRVGGEAKTPEERGVLAEFDGTDWKIVERRQFTEVTGPKGITGGSDGNEPIWTMGWDRRSVRLKVLDEGQWHTYLLPKAAYCNDAQHGWYTEWPRIREITEGRWMMDMHGMFFEFPQTFSSTNSAGIKPIGSHLRYVPDFCDWNGRLVLASDETSIQGNPLAGQPQSNLWFGSYDDLKSWGPASGYGGPWIEDQVGANIPSDPFLVAGFDRRVLHLGVGQKTKPAFKAALRATGDLEIKEMSAELTMLPRVTMARGDWKKPAGGFEFAVDQPVTIYLAVDGRGESLLSEAWKPTQLSLSWGKGVRDRIFSRKFPAGTISIPGNLNEHSPGAFGVPHMAFVNFANNPVGKISGDGVAVTDPNVDPYPAAEGEPAVRMTLQLDRLGNGLWMDLETIEVPANGYVEKVLPQDLDAVWIRLTADRDCVATAILHQTTGTYIDGNAEGNQALFAGLANVDDKAALGGVVYPAKRDRDLRLITSDNRYFDFTKTGFEFEAEDVDAKLGSLLEIQAEFTVDEASVVVEYKGQKLRLPKGDSRYDAPFAGGWPRGSREVESERHLANFHGTFYEVPLVTNGAPPAWNLMRPVSSHSKQITDFCSWNGLLVLCGVRPNAKNDGHVFSDPKHKTAIWFGGIDDLWKLGKPVGQGGPWLKTDVTAGVPSDPYLIKGYDKKTARISHNSSHAVPITLQIDLDGTGLWVDYCEILVPPGEEATYEFKSEFSAVWIRGLSDQDTQATLLFGYR